MKAIAHTPGTKITAAGLYSGVPLEEYHGDLCGEPSVSKSGLWEFGGPEGSPAHFFQASYLNPEAEPFEASDALILGQGAHHLLLGESDFRTHFVVRPEEYPDPERAGQTKAWNSNANWCKAWLKTERDAGRTILKGEQIKAIRGMSRSLAAHPLVAAGILNGLVEHTLVYRDRETGIWVKVRPDVVPTDDLDIADFKTCTSVSHRAIDSAIGSFGYFLQGGMVRMAFREVFGQEVSSFTLVFAEKTPPYCVRVVAMKDVDLELGEQLAGAALKLMRRCLDRGVWPGPGGEQSDAIYAEMLPWARTDAEYRINRMIEEAAAL